MITAAVISKDFLNILNSWLSLGDSNLKIKVNKMGDELLIGDSYKLPCDANGTDNGTTLNRKQVQSVCDILGRIDNRPIRLGFRSHTLNIELTI